MWIDIQLPGTNEAHPCLYDRFLPLWVWVLPVLFPSHFLVSPFFWLTARFLILRRNESTKHRLWYGATPQGWGHPLLERRDRRSHRGQLVNVQQMWSDKQDTVYMPKESCFCFRFVVRFPNFPLRRACRASWPAFLEAGWNSFSFLTFVAAAAAFVVLAGAIAYWRGQIEEEICMICAICALALENEIVGMFSVYFRQ